MTGSAADGRASDRLGHGRALRHHGRLDYFRARLAALPPNRAVFEVLDLIAEALEATAGAPERYALPRARTGRGSSQGTGSSQ